MILKCVKQPETEPITQIDVEGQIRLLDLSDESVTIETFISAIRQRAESETRRALNTQEWWLILDSFPSGRGKLEIPLPPLQSVDSIVYFDITNVAQTLDPTFYRVVAESEPAYVVPVVNQNWPETINDVGVVTVKFTCGYGDNSGDVPAAIRQWMLLNIANLYENRETIAIGNRFAMVELNTIADSLLVPYRVYTF